jgi:hypothetical protein
MWVSVEQITPDGNEWNDINTDLVERVRNNPRGDGLVFHLQSGFEVDVVQNRDWWETQKKGET